jgi:hypothetical protein
MDADSRKRRDANGSVGEGGEAQRTLLHNTTRTERSVDGDYKLAIRAPAKPLRYGPPSI